MKQLFLKTLFLILASMVASTALAGGIECKTCPCAPGLNFIPKNECNIKKAGIFCANNGGHIQGWSISNDQTYMIDSLAGVPSPYTSFHVLPSRQDSSFQIVEMERFGQVVSTYGPFHWIGTEAITDGVTTFESDLCN